MCVSFKCRWKKMELHDVIVECAKYSALDPLERPREEVSYQGLPPTLWPRYSNMGNFISCFLLCTDLTHLLTLEVPLCYCQSSVCEYSFLENLKEGDHMRHRCMWGDNIEIFSKILGWDDWTRFARHGIGPVVGFSEHGSGPLGS